MECGKKQRKKTEKSRKKQKKDSKNIIFLLCKISHFITLHTIDSLEEMLKNATSQSTSIVLHQSKSKVKPGTYLRLGNARFNKLKTFL